MSEDDRADREASDSEADSGPNHPQNDQSPDEVSYEEVTLADLLDVLVRRKRLLVGTFLVVLLGTVAITALTTPTYEAQATIISTNERDEVLSVMRSESFREDVGTHLEANTSAPADDLSQASVSVQRGTGQIGEQDKTIISITAEHPTGEGAAAIANGYVPTLEDWRPYLENITKAKKWQQYYEEADKNTTQAHADLDGLLENREYWRSLDQAQVPSEPVSPDWQLNLALGATLAVMLALFVPFLVEGVANAREK